MTKYYIVGQRADGSRAIIQTTTNRDQAERLAAVFAAHLEGYSAIVVERVEARHQQPGRHTREEVRP